MVGAVSPSNSHCRSRLCVRGGDYLILNGGNDIRINAHVKTLDESVPRFRADRGQSYGVDTIEIARFGLRASNLVPSDPAAYRIYGQPVLAPCAGKIVMAIDGFPDLTIPEIDRVNRSGNYAILRCGDADIAPRASGFKLGWRLRLAIGLPRWAILARATNPTYTFMPSDPDRLAHLCLEIPCRSD